MGRELNWNKDKIPLVRMVPIPAAIAIKGAKKTAFSRNELGRVGNLEKNLPTSISNESAWITAMEISITKLAHKVHKVESL